MRERERSERDGGAKETEERKRQRSERDMNERYKGAKDTEE